MESPSARAFALATASATSKLYRLDRPPPSSPTSVTRPAVAHATLPTFTPWSDATPSRVTSSRTKQTPSPRGSSQRDPPHPPRYPFQCAAAVSSVFLATMRGVDGIDGVDAAIDARPPPPPSDPGRTQTSCTGPSDARLGSTDSSSSPVVLEPTSTYHSSSVSVKDCPALDAKYSRVESCDQHDARVRSAPACVTCVTGPPSVGTT
mmetsp:Transcript_5371/g.24201  ORF Transcript_5371/g.24201 Transcript_5371/m.24201 type:complete len:206 (+) Transcript_5371:97-714(+)